MSLSTPIYSRDSNGKVRSWQYEVDGALWRVHSGLLDGKKAVSGWTLCMTTNAGKKNEREPVAQAAFESAAEEAKKLDREYRRTVEELASVPPSPMLAQDFKKQKRIKYPCYGQPKLDGIRSLTSRHGAFSREFQPHNNIEHIVEGLAPAFARYPELVLDGELYNHDLRDDFNTISSVVRTNKNITPEDRERARDLIQYHVYDMVSSNPFGTRATVIEGIVAELNHPSIVYVPTRYIQTSAELDAAYEEWLAQGYEGQMVRVSDDPYEISKRSKTLLKRKEFETEEFEVVNIEEGTGNWHAYAKKVFFRLPNGDVQGSGMRGDQAFTKKLLADKERYIGCYVTIRFFGKTPDGFCRFPVAVDWHPAGRRD